MHNVCANQSSLAGTGGNNHCHKDKVRPAKQAWLAHPQNDTLNNCKEDKNNCGISRKMKFHWKLTDIKNHKRIRISSL